MGKMLLYGIPGVTMCMTAFWPSLLQLYFATTAVFSIGQVYLLQNPRFRSMVNIAPLVGPPPRKDPSEVKIVDWITPSEVKNAVEKNEAEKNEQQERDGDKKP